jgi:hypothetical protein
MNKKRDLAWILAVSALSITGTNIDSPTGTSGNSGSYSGNTVLVGDTASRKTAASFFDPSKLFVLPGYTLDSGYLAFPLMMNPKYEKELKFKASLDSLDRMASNMSDNYNRDSVMHLINKTLDSFKDYSAVVNRDFARGMMSAESRFNPYVKSEADARGLMQPLQPTWNMFSSKPFEKFAYDVPENIHVGLKYMRFLERFCADNHPSWDSISIEGQRDLISAAYNAGHGALQDSKWDIAHVNTKTDETVNHVFKVDTAMYHNKKYVPTFMRKPVVEASVLPVAQLVSDTLKYYQ